MTLAPVNPVLVRWARECSAIAPEDPVETFAGRPGVSICERVGPRDGPPGGKS